MFRCLFQWRQTATDNNTNDHTNGKLQTILLNTSKKQKFFPIYMGLGLYANLRFYSP